MGVIISAIGRHIESVEAKAVDHVPISYLRSHDYTPAGNARDGVEATWEVAMKSMITADLSTRQLLFPVLHTRLRDLEASSKFTQCDIESLLQQYKDWDDLKLFALHDLFQVFEVNGDGLIEIAEMCVGLDNLGDTTTVKERLSKLCSADDDDTGSIDFEEFCQIIYDLEHNPVMDPGSHPLAKFYKRVDDNIRFIRHMSAIQQIQAGFF